MDGAALGNLPVLFEVVKRRELACQAFLLNNTKENERLIPYLRVLCWNGEKQCTMPWPSKSCSSPCSRAEGKYAQQNPVFR